MTKTSPDLEVAKKLLEENGYKVKRSRSTLVRTTVELDPDLVADVYRARQAEDLSFKEVVELALRDWVNSRPK